MEQADGSLTESDLTQITWEAAYERARLVAYYILGDLRAAAKVALWVAESMERAGAVERAKRVGARLVYYKVEPDRALLLDRLIYAATLPHEKRQEELHRRGEARLGREDLAVRFVKELIAHTSAHNAFYVLVGNFRVLSNYSSGDTQKVYDLLTQASHTPEPAEYRRCKGRLMERLEKRFRGFVEVVEVGEQREHRFRTPDAADARADEDARAVEECLGVLTPLEPGCTHIPRGFDPTHDVLTEFQAAAWDSRVAEPDEQARERKRIHMLIHPPCLLRLTDVLALPAPAARLELPQFFLGDGDEGDDDDTPPPLGSGRFPPPLDRERLAWLADVSRRRRRRGGPPPDEIMLVVDGVERGIVRLDAPQPLALEVEEGDGLVEFKGRDGDGWRPLGAHLLEWPGVRDEATEAFRLAVGGGRELRFEITYAEGAGGTAEGATATVALSYASARAAAVGGRLLMWPALAAATAALAAASVVAAGATAFIYYRRRKNKTTDE